MVTASIGAVIDVALLWSLSTDAHRLGVTWVILGLIYLAVLTRGFRRKPPEVGTAQH